MRPGVVLGGQNFATGGTLEAVPGGFEFIPGVLRGPPGLYPEAARKRSDLSKIGALNHS